MICDSLDESDDVVLVLEQVGSGDAGLVIAAANGQFCRTSGYTNTEVVGRPLLSLAVSDKNLATYSETLKAASECRSVRSEFLCGRTDGSHFWLGMHLIPARRSLSQFFVALGRDITEEVQERQQRSATEGLLAKVFLCVQIPVAIVTADGLIQMTNPAFDHSLGYPPGRLVGKRAIEYVAPGTRAVVAAARQRQLDEGRDYTVAASLLRSDGSEISVELTSITVDRADLRRFRIITLIPRTDAASVAVHVAGKIKLVGLREVKASLGSRWETVADRAMATAEHVIKSRCDRGDTYARTPEGDFLLCFSAGTNEDEAAFRAASIAREIRLRLIGEGQDSRTADVSAITTAIELTGGKSETGDLLNAALSERLNARLAASEAKAREILRAATATAACELEPVYGARAKTPVAFFASLPAKLDQRIQAAYGALPAAERAAYDYDRLVLGVAAEQAVADTHHRARIIFVNVSFEVILDRHLEERYLETCRSLDQRVRDRLILIVDGVSQTCPQVRLFDWVTRIRSLCHGIGFQFETPEQPRFDLMALSSPIFSLRIDPGGVRDEQLLAKIARVVQRLHAGNSRVLVRRVKSFEDARLLYERGVDLVAYGAVHCPPPLASAPADATHR